MWTYVTYAAAIVVSLVMIRMGVSWLFERLAIRTYRRCGLSLVREAVAGAERIFPADRQRLAEAVRQKIAQAEEQQERGTPLYLLWVNKEVTKAHTARHHALRAGAVSYADPQWCQAYLIESWLVSEGYALKGWIRRSEADGIQSLITGFISRTIVNEPVRQVER